jgi:hypothetical protein
MPDEAVVGFVPEVQFDSMLPLGRCEPRRAAMAPLRAGVPVGILTCEPHGVVTTPRSTPTPCHSIGRGELGADTGISDFVAGRAGSGGDALGANLRLRSNGTEQRCSHRKFTSQASSRTHTHSRAKMAMDLSEATRGSGDPLRRISASECICASAAPKIALLQCTRKPKHSLIGRVARQN